MPKGSANRAVDSFDKPTDANLEQLLRTFGRQLQLTIRTHCPAKVVLFDPATQTATVEVGFRPVVPVTDVEKIPLPPAIVKGTPPNGEAALPAIVLQRIPVVFDGTSSAYVSYPILPGTTGELHIADRSLESWLQQGIATDPVLAFTHALKDGVFHPGLRPTTAPIIPPIDLTALVVEASQVKLGRLATEHVTKAESLIAQLIVAVTASATTPGDGGAAFKANLLTQLNIILAAIATVSSTKVTVE